MATDQADTVTQAMPVPGAGALMQHVPVLSIARSLTNPRKHFDPTKLQELADSIAASGVHQSILIRPLPASRIKDEMAWARAEKREPAQYELVCGERRWRASQLAKVAEIPAMIRPLTDAQALEAQIIENLQRDDITELEEAEGYQALMETQNITDDQLAAKVGKSRSYIYARLKALDLCEQARDALRQGKIDFSKGLLIARIPDEALQLKALEFCVHTNYNGDTMGYRACFQHVQQHYMLKLNGAPFKITDANLIPRAGSCKECPKRTGANADLFQDVGSADVCTDPKCYHAKEEAHANALKRGALERGQIIIEGREARTLMPSAYSSTVKGYLRLDDKDDSPTDKPLRKLIGKAMDARGIQPTLIANPHKDGQLVAVLTPGQVEVLLKDVNNEEVAAKIKADADRDADAAKQKETADAKQHYESQWRWDVLATTWQQITGGVHECPTDEVLRYIATSYAKAYSQDRAKKICKLLDLGKVAPVAGLLQYIADTDVPADILQLLVMHGDVEYRYWQEEAKANAGLLLVAKDFGVDVAAVKAKTKANQRAEQAAAKAKQAQKAAQDAAPEGTSTPTPAAQAQKGARGKGKKGQSPAAPAAKMSAEEAQAHIAAAMQAAAPSQAEQESGAAAAAQGDEGTPVADAQESISGADAPGDEPAPEADARAPAVDPGQDVQTSAPATPPAAAADVGGQGHAPDPAAFKEGVKVRILAAADLAPKYEHLRGQEGELRYAVGIRKNVWRVAFLGVLKRGAPTVESFGINQLEIVQ